MFVVTVCTCCLDPLIHFNASCTFHVVPFVFVKGTVNIHS